MGTHVLHGVIMGGREGGKEGGREGGREGGGREGGRGRERKNSLGSIWREFTIYWSNVNCGQTMLPPYAKHCSHPEML